MIRANGIAAAAHLIRDSIVVLENNINNIVSMHHISSQMCLSVCVNHVPALLYYVIIMCMQADADMLTTLITYSLLYLVVRKQISAADAIRLVY